MKVTGDTLTAMGKIEMVALFASAAFAMELALIVTVPPDGLFAGAVYVVDAPLAVCAGVNEPQSLEPQLTDH